MKPKTLGLILRIICILLALMGAAVLFLAFTGFYDPGDTRNYASSLPWLSIPCWGALIAFWRVAGNISRDRSFCAENVRCMRIIAVLAFLDTAGVIVSGAVLLARQVIGPRILPFLLCIVILGGCIGLACLALSVLVDRARAIQEENDYTV